MSATATEPTVIANDILKAVEDLKKEGASLKEIVKGLNEPAPNLRAHTDDDGAVLSYWGASRQKAIFDPQNPYAPLDRVKPKGYKNDQWKSLGEFIRSGFKSHKASPTDALEWQGKHRGCFKAIQGMSEQVGSDGGYLVLPEFNTQILEKVYANDLFSKTQGYTVTGNGMMFLRNAETSRANGSRHGGLRGYWTAEGGSGTDSKPTFKQVQLRLNKLMVVVYLTNELLDDAGPSIEQYVTRKAADEFNFMLGDALFNGVGGGMPLGILQSPALLSITKEDGQLADTIVSQNVDKMWARRWAGGSYEWFANQDTQPQLQQLVQEIGTGGQALARTDITSAQRQSLKGASLRETEFNPTLGDLGDLLLGDLSQVISITKGGISQEASMHVEFLTDQTAVRFTMRVDARPWEDSPVTPFKGSATQSSFVAIAAR